MTGSCAIACLLSESCIKLILILGGVFQGSFAFAPPLRLKLKRIIKIKVNCKKRVCLPNVKNNSDVCTPGYPVSYYKYAPVNAACG